MIALSILTTAVALVQPSFPTPYVDSLRARVYEDRSALVVMHGDSRVDAPMPHKVPTARPWHCTSPMQANLICTTRFTGGARLFRLRYVANVGDLTLTMTMGNGDG